MENTAIQVFKNINFGEVRTVIRDGEPWFVAADICRALEIGNPTDAMSRLEPDEYTLVSIEGASNGKPVNAVSESGLYSLVLGSRKPKARAFKRWITHEVIPSIRKHGAYMTPEKIEEALADPDTVIRWATMLKAERQKRIEAERQRDILIHVNKTFTSTELAKEIGFTSAKSLNQYLCECGIQFKMNGTWVLFGKYADLGYTEIKQSALDNGKVVYDRRWTNEGRAFILDFMKRQNAFAF